MAYGFSNPIRYDNLGRAYQNHVSDGHLPRQVWTEPGGYRNVYPATPPTTAPAPSGAPPVAPGSSTTPLPPLQPLSSILALPESRWARATFPGGKAELLRSGDRVHTTLERPFERTLRFQVPTDLGATWTRVHCAAMPRVGIRETTVTGTVDVRMVGGDLEVRAGAGRPVTTVPAGSVR